jgi:hypothetical protein
MAPEAHRSCHGEVGGPLPTWMIDRPWVRDAMHPGVYREFTEPRPCALRSDMPNFAENVRGWICCFRAGYRLHCAVVATFADDGLEMVHPTSGASENVSRPRSRPAPGMFDGRRLSSADVPIKGL